MIPVFTPKELKILKWVTRGLKNKEVAAKLGSTEHGVKNRMRDIYEKTGMSNRVELALWAIKNLGMALLVAMLTAASFSQTHSVTLNWHASTTGGVTYNVYRATVSSKKNPCGQSPLYVGDSSLTYTDTNVTNGVSYHYGVKALLNGAFSKCSNIIRVVVP